MSAFFSTVFSMLWGITQVALAYLLADFLSGVLHWFQDRYCQRHWPVIGDVIVAPNDIHHADPRAFTQDGFFHRNWASFFVGASLFGVFAVTNSLNWFTGGFAAASSLLPTQAHYWAHRTKRQNGPVISRLQDWGLIQSSRQHWSHHRGAKDINFCTMTDFVNPVLERVQFFQRVEKLIMLTLNVEPKPG